MAGVAGLEPAVTALEADGLPLTDTPKNCHALKRCLRAGCSTMSSRNGAGPDARSLLTFTRNRVRPQVTKQLPVLSGLSQATTKQKTRLFWRVCISILDWAFSLVGPQGEQTLTDMAIPPLLSARI